MFLSKRERPTGGKKWTWTRPFARPRPSSTSDEGGSVVPNSRLITYSVVACCWLCMHLAVFGGTFGEVMGRLSPP